MLNLYRSINWNRPVKRYVNDEIMASYLCEEFMGLPWVKILTLPSEDWLFSRSLAKLLNKEGIGCSVHGVEEKEPEYKESQEVAERITTNEAKFSHLFQAPVTLRDFIKEAAKIGCAYNLIFADWCGTYCKAKEEDMEAILDSGTLMRDSFLMFTFGASRIKPHVIEMLEDVEQERTYPIDIIEGTPCRDPHRFNLLTNGVINRIMSLFWEKGLEHIKTVAYFSFDMNNGGRRSAQFVMLFRTE